MAGDALGFGVSFFILWTEEGLYEKRKMQKNGWTWNACLGVRKYWCEPLLFFLLRAKES
jgi:hypothetical protein